MTDELLGNRELLGGLFTVGLRDFSAQPSVCSDDTNTACIPPVLYIYCLPTRIPSKDQGIDFRALRAIVPLLSLHTSPVSGC